MPLCSCLRQLNVPTTVVVLPWGTHRAVVDARTDGLDAGELPLVLQAARLEDNLRKEHGCLHFVSGDQPCWEAVDEGGVLVVARRRKTGGGDGAGELLPKDEAYFSVGTNCTVSVSSIFSAGRTPGCPLRGRD